ncbi:cytochrome P450 [Microthyrium microscopicum]|uniref:Cytochrome P450 n=1 Tax=Microthyrium microscopicum TaxID=703497 RepID=A0A6A6U3A4_9PEZI|nr:cytochrome P450 [Microthyrium microscopicum]
MTVLLELLGEVLSSPLLILECLLGAAVVYLAVGVAWRLTFHPLAGYPGPLLAKVTDLYLAYHAWKGDRHLEFYRCHQKYGPVVRLGPNLLSFNTSTALKSIYGFKSNVRKSDFYTAFPANKQTTNVHSTIDKSLHARKRRVISHAFADSAIKSMEKYVLGNIDTACNIISDDVSTKRKAMATNYYAEKTDSWSTPRNMARWADWLTFDIMGDLVFGKAFGMLESPQNRFAIDLVSSAAKRHLICGTHLPIHNYHLDKLLFPAIAAKRTAYMSYSRAQSSARTQLGTDSCDRKDFFFHLLNAHDPETGKGFSPAELWGESNLFIIAGSDTTSTALAATLFYLVHDTSALKSATAEVRAAFANVNEVVAGATLNECEFLRACIDEAMRLSPPVPGALPRKVLEGGLLVDNVHVPAGVDVCVAHYAIHHNEAYYPRPFSYEPSRWMGDSEAAHAAFCAFSVGPRGCIGKGLAYVELMLSMARVLVQFDMRLAPGTSVGEGREDLEEGRKRGTEYQLKDTFTSIKDGPMVQFKGREI